MLTISSRRLVPDRVISLLIVEHDVQSSILRRKDTGIPYDISIRINLIAYAASEGSGEPCIRTVSPKPSLL